MISKKVIKQFEVWSVEFDQKTRPAVVVSNNILNDLYETVIVAPLTSSVRIDFPSRVDTDFEDKGGQIAIDQLKCFDKGRLKKKIGIISPAERRDVLDILHHIFTPE